MKQWGNILVTSNSKYVYSGFQIRGFFFFLIQWVIQIAQPFDDYNAEVTAIPLMGSGWPLKLQPSTLDYSRNKEEWEMVVPVFRKQKISGQTQNEFLPPVHWLKLCIEATANGKMTKEQGIWNQGLVSP